MNAPAIRARLDAAEPVNIWPVPDISILDAGRSKPVAMPSDMFGSVWPLLCELAEGAGAPVDYTALSFATVAASLIGGKRKVRPFHGHDWTEPCIIWAAAVGDPSANKSPAIDAATGPLRAMEALHAEDHREALRRWEAESERAKCEQAAWAENVKTAQKDNLATPGKPDVALAPEPPVRRRLMVMDATPEAIGQILSGNPSGTLHLRDELAGWLTSFDRYSPGGREFWLEAYGGRTHVIDRKGAAVPLTIKFNGVSVLGGIQPEKLSECLLSGSDDGLVARFLWAWPNSIPFRRPRNIADIARLERIYERLDGLRWGIGQSAEQIPITLPLDPAAADLFETWAQENQQGLDDAGSLYKGFCGKLKGTLLRLSLMAELVAWADGKEDSDEPRSISARTVGAVAEFIEQYAKPAALRVFGDAALPMVERHSATLARYIQRHKLRRINARDIRRTANLPGLKDAQPISDAIAALIEADWLREAGKRAGDTAGRKTSDYVVNPAIHGAA